MTDAGNRMVRAYGRGCARSMGIQIGLIVLVFGGFFAVVLVAALIPGDRDNRIWIFIICLLAFLGIVLMATVIWAVVTLRRRARKLDDAFTPLGLEAGMYLTNGRQYHGTVSGYPVDAYFYRGPTLDIYIQYPFSTRMGATLKSGLNRFTSDLINREPVQISDPAYADVAVYAIDPDWADDLLADSRVRQAFLQLIQPAHDIEVRNVLVTPGALHLQMRFTHTRCLTPENIRSWVEAMVRVVRATAGIPKPTVTAEATSLENTVRTSRGKLFLPIAGITCGVLALMSVCVTIITFVLIYLTESGTF